MEINKIYHYTIMFWTIILLVVFIFVSNQRVESTKQIAKHIVDSSLTQDKMFRQWASSHGGFYVKTNKRTPPNPNLSHIKNRDVTTKDMHLTLMNPAYMLRQMMHEYSGLYGLKGHITSLKVLNKKYNSPDRWENYILHKLEKDKNFDTVYEFMKIGDKNYLKAFEPLVTQESCLKCHGTQGYKVGDLRGGVTVTLPMDTLLKEQNRTLFKFAIAFFIIYVIGFISIRLFYNKSLKELEIQKRLQIKLFQSEKYFKTIVNTSKNIMIINNKKNLENANQAFFEFVGFPSIEDFKKVHECICDMFSEKEGYISKLIKGMYWLEYIVQNPDKTYKAVIKKDHIEYIFSVNVNEFEIEGEKRYIAVFNDITELVEKEKALLIQSKMAAMGEMLENIAHQWRQPLGVISASSSGMKLQKEYGVLDEEQLLQSLDDITESAEFLSTTIDDFRSFFKVDKEKMNFDLAGAYDRTTMLLSSKFKNRNIKLIEDNDHIEILGYENEIIQALMNILNNAKDALEKIPDEEDRFIFVSLKKEDNDIVLSIKDNAGGIPEQYISKVFDQRFTTKQDRDGTGIGLYMTKQIIKKINGTISVKNDTFTYNNKEYKGAKIIIRIPIIN